MNLTELARILKINPQELRDILPQFGFHVGQKAIKVDNRTAQKIIRDWPKILRQIEEAKRAKELEDQKKAGIIEVQKKVSIPSHITIRDFANTSDIPVNKVLTELMKNGIFASMNERIDFDTASIIGSELGIEVNLKKGDNQPEKEEIKLKEILDKQDKNKMKTRPPVVVVMGHVDHGKTKLLDAIRRTDVVAGEAGGITQHIGAYQVTRRNRLISFIDTPGHEAFTAMRSRGAKVADIAILVIAADDGVKPQTIEAFRIIEAAKIPYIVAINKIDKPDSNIDKTKQELSSKLKITPEDWGGKIICAPISAKEGTGIVELLDVLLLLADMGTDERLANPDADAAGTVIESHVDKGAGPVATILIQNGTLRIGDQLCYKGTIYGKVKALKNYSGEVVNSVEPSMPAQILGLKILPEVGDILEVGEGKKVKLKNIKSDEKDKSSNNQCSEDKDTNIKTINLLIKSDGLGSAEAIEESLEKINTKKIKVKIIYKGLGNITEGDIQKAESSNAQICGFNIKTPLQTENLIREKNITVKIFTIIYDLIKYVKEEMEKLVEPEYQRIDLGRLKVLAIFRTENSSQIIGGKVIDGKIESDSLIEVIQNDSVVATGKLTRLQSAKQDVNRVEKDIECGLQYEGKPIIEEGDILNFYKREIIIDND